MAFIENRTYLNASVIKLTAPKPKWTPEVEFGNDCCEKYLVCGKDGGESWEKDYTSAWMKLYTSADTVTFELLKDGVASVVPDVFDIKDETYSKYCTVDWTEVLNTDGAGCYQLNVYYTVAGVTDSFTWGEYQLFEFSPLIVNGTCRVKTVFNSRHSLESIDFTKSKVVDTYRFKGFFGDRQPNMEVDNIIYPNRQVKKVTRENVNEYTLTAYSLKYYNVVRLVDLMLLGENEIYISDFNPVNPTYEYLDTPLIVAKSPEIKYHEATRLSTVTAVMNDKTKDIRTFY